MSVALLMYSPSRLLLWSQVIYLCGALLTLGAAALVLYERRFPGRGLPLRRRLSVEALVVIAAAAALLGVIGAVHFGSVASHVAELDVARYKAAANVTVAQAQRDAEFAKALAASATGAAAAAKRIEAASGQGNTGHRSLTVEQQAGIAVKLSSLRGRVDLFYQYDPAIFPLAQEIANSLTGWDIHSFEPSGEAGQGISIEYDPRNPQSKHTAEQVAEELRACSLPVNAPAGDLPSAANYTSKLGEKAESPLRITVGRT
jgi:hypothetical protein